MTWKRIRSLVRRTLLTRLSEHEEIDDLVQEVLMHLVGSLPRLREPAALPGFVRAIALNTASQAIRRARRERRWRVRVDDEEASAQLQPRDEGAHGSDRAGPGQRSHPRRHPVLQRRRRLQPDHAVAGPRLSGVPPAGASATTTTTIRTRMPRTPST